MGDMEEKGALRLLNMIYNYLKIKGFYFFVSKKCPI